MAIDLIPSIVCFTEALNVCISNVYCCRLFNIYLNKNVEHQ